MAAPPPPAPLPLPPAMAPPPPPLPPQPSHLPNPPHPMHQTLPSSKVSSITTLSKLNPTTIILTHIPPFLRHPRNLRDLLYSTSSIKHLFYSCAIKRFANDNSSNDEKNENVVAVVKLSHAAHALSLIRNWKFVRSILNNENGKDGKEDDAEKRKCKMNAFLLYTDGPISLHPEKSQVDAGMIETIWDMAFEKRNTSTDAGKVAQQADDNMVSSLVETYRAIEKRQLDLDADAARNGVDGSNGFNLTATYAATGGSSNVNGADNNDDPNSTEKEQSDKDGNSVSNINNSHDEDKVKLDSAKVRAAAGGGAYDEEADPLNAPEVLEAVKQFKKKLEVTQGGHRRKRKEYLDKRFKEEIQKAKSRLIEMRKREKEALSSLPPPPLPPHLPPPPLPPGGMPPPVPPSQQQQQSNATAPARDTGRRGISNLPAWMTAGKDNAANNNDNETKKRPADDITPSSEGLDNSDGPATKKKFIPSEANREINARKERLVVDNNGGQSLADIRAENEAADKKAKMEEAKKKRKEYIEKATCFTKDEILTGSFFPKLDDSRPEAIPTLRAFVKEQLVEYLGEEEATLVDFVMNHLVKNDDADGGGMILGKSVDPLLEEMKIVLEEDAETFVVDLFKKVIEMLK